jgi:hypothetical protein
MKLLNENFIAFHNEKHVTNYAGSSVQNLEAIQLNEMGISTIHQLFTEISKTEDQLTRKRSRILGWLMRTWAEQEIVSKFNALFIPLEMILSGIQGELPESQCKQTEALQNLIDTYGGADKETYKSLLNKLVRNQRPSLIGRFNMFAEQAKMPGWEDDIKAFKKFNTIRNSLMHRGDPNVSIHVLVGESDLHALEDLTERYINFFLFRDTAVYQSIFVPRPQPST